MSKSDIFTSGTAGLLHLTGFIKVKVMSCTSRQQGLWWQHLLLSKLIKLSSLTSGRGKAGFWEGDRVGGQQHPRLSNVSIMEYELSDEDGMRRTVKGSGGRGMDRGRSDGGHHRENSSTDGPPPGCLSWEIAPDMKSKGQVNQDSLFFKVFVLFLWRLQNLFCIVVVFSLSKQKKLQHL